MCPPPDPVARAAASRGESPARGHVPPPPDVGPRTEPRAEIVAAPDRTVVTRRPRVSHRAAEPHELLPTLRLPPVEARALRRQVSADAGGDAELPIDSGEIEAAAPSPTTAPTSLRSMPGPPRLHRPPLPMPDVLRQGPRAAPRRAGGEPPVELTARATAVPETVMTIDTASLVLEVAESLTTAAPVSSHALEASEGTAIDVAAPAVEPDAPPRAIEAVAPDVAAPPIDRTPTLARPAAAMVRTRRRWAPWLVGLTAVAASVVGALWAFVPTPQTASASLEPLREQLNSVQPDAAPQLVVPSAPIAAEVTPRPTPAPMQAPALVPPPPAAEPTLPLLAIATPSETAAVPEVPADVPLLEAEAPRETPPKSKSKSKSRSKSKSKTSTPPPKASTKVAAPAPTLDATALLREAESAFAEGRHGTALRNAQRSLAARNDPRAARIVVLSACKLGRQDVARANFERLPLGQRRGVRNTCKDAGVRVGS